jgi:putative membrane protein
MRPVFLIAGVLTLAAAWIWPLPALARSAFYAHMTMHMAVVAVAAPFLAWAVMGTSFDPVRKIPTLFRAIPLSMVELVAVWGWHAPALHHAARHSLVGLMAEQGTFFITGLLVWLSAFGGDVRFGGNRSAAGVVALLLTSMHMTLLGALLALTPRPLYAHHEGTSRLSALDDQQLGGAIMLAVGGISYLFGGLWLMVGLLRQRGLLKKASV